MKSAGARQKLGTPADSPRRGNGSAGIRRITSLSPQRSRIPAPAPNKATGLPGSSAPRVGLRKGVAIRKYWPFSFNFFLFAGYAFAFPYVVLFYQSLGFNGGQIGILTGITPLITFFAGPFWTGLADTLKRHRLIMSVVLLISTAGMACYPLMRAFLPMWP